MYKINKGLNLLRADNRTEGIASAICAAEDALKAKKFSKAVLISPLKRISDRRIINGGDFSLHFSAGLSTSPLNAWTIDWDEAMQSIEAARASHGCREAEYFNGGYESLTGWELSEVQKIMPENDSTVLHVWDIWDDASVDIDTLVSVCKRLDITAIVLVSSQR